MGNHPRRPVAHHRARRRRRHLHQSAPRRMPIHHQLGHPRLRRRVRRRGSRRRATAAGPVTTKADFYDRRGPSAVWLGSLQGDADPETIRTVACGRLLLDATDPLTYADAITDLLDVWADEGHGHGYHPRHGWPCVLWPDSPDTRGL